MSNEKDNNAADISLSEQIRMNNLQNVMLTDTDLHMFGDWTVLAQVTQLLSYIRYAIQHKQKATITVNVGRAVDSAQFSFDANGCQVPELEPVDTFEIN